MTKHFGDCRVKIAITLSIMGQSTSDKTKDLINQLLKYKKCTFLAFKGEI